MSGAFAGLCIGGPWAGKRHEHSEPRFRIPLRQPLPRCVVAPDQKPTERADKLVFEYAHHDIGPVFFGLAFWVPLSWPAHKRTDFVLDALIARYQACPPNFEPPA